MSAAASPMNSLADPAPFRRSVPEAHLLTLNPKAGHADHLDVCAAKEVRTQFNREGERWRGARSSASCVNRDYATPRRGGRRRLTTVADETDHRAADLIERRFRASAPHQLRVANSPLPRRPVSGKSRVISLSQVSAALDDWRGNEITHLAAGDRRIRPRAGGKETDNESTASGLVTRIPGSRNPTNVHTIASGAARAAARRSGRKRSPTARTPE
jgi:hypothetical protein